jgi:hypothetical protein
MSIFDLRLKQWSATHFPRSRMPASTLSTIKLSQSLVSNAVTAIPPDASRRSSLISVIGCAAHINESNTQVLSTVAK